MKRIVATAAATALAVAGVPAVTAVASPFGSSSSSSSIPQPATPEQRIRTAIEANLIHDGYTIDSELTRIAQLSLTAETQAERDDAYAQLRAAGMVSGQGGSLVSDVEAIEAYFATEGEPRPSNGQKVAVAVDYNTVTTPYRVYFFE